MAASRSLNQVSWLRDRLVRLRAAWLRRVRGFDIGPDVDISFSARFVPSVRGAISVGEQSSIGPLSVLCATLPDGGLDPIRVGPRCFIGGGVVIAPGVSVGDGVVAAAGAVILRDVPADCIVAGNPARVVRKGIGAGRFGRLPKSDPARRRQQFEETIRTLLRDTGR